ncbi:hypothetical protein Tco_1038744 [Tanacetum coccineum]
MGFQKQEEEANIALIDSWENTQAMMEADRLLAERLQSKEREELTDEEKGKLFMELIEKEENILKAKKRRYKVVRRQLKAAERRCIEGKEQGKNNSKNPQRNKE